MVHQSRHLARSCEVFFIAISQDIADRCTIGDENSPGPASAYRGAKTVLQTVFRAREMDGRVMLYIPSFSFAYSSGLTTVTVHCAVKPPQSAVRVVVP